MSNLESIVPPVAMCKLIPAGEFVDSALVWDIHGKFDKWHVEKRVKRSVRFGDYGVTSPPHADIPAPTLEEIRKKLRILSIVPGDAAVHVFCKIDPENLVSTIAVNENDVTAAALRLWFEVKGGANEIE